MVITGKFVRIDAGVKVAVPKKKVSLRRGRLRRTHYVVRLLAKGKCTQCGRSIVNFTVCNACGFYKDRSYASVLNIKTA